ncbi:MAG: hypothetical protein IJY69_02320 [Clostridia bacterium]|nr:hypothetical protein [Clostridia bacterium]
MLLIVLLISLLFLTVTLMLGYSEVYLIIRDGLRVKICFALFSVELSNFKNNKRKRRNSRDIRRVVLSYVSEAIEQCEVHIRRICVPLQVSSDPISAISEYRCRWIISAAVAYFDSKSKKLLIHDNAFTLIPDKDAEFSLIISLKIRTYRLIFMIARLYVELRERRRYYVGK